MEELNLCKSEKVKVVSTVGAGDSFAAAFWNCLTDMAGRPVHIEIIGLDVIERKFGDEANTLTETLKEFKHYDNDEYVNDIQINIVRGDTRISLK